MTFLRNDLYIVVIPLLLILLLLFYKSESSKSEFIQKTFFKKKTLIAKVRDFLFYIGIILLGVSIFDPRGPQEKIESNVRDQKTIVIIDSSASMLAEDVRPNRFKKSLLMARHFIKKAYGHKIAVVLFSDTQKRLVPFTDDLDLLDARIAGLEKLVLYNGGSNISQAIKESLGYFRLDQGKSETISGNLLVFTDSEGHDDGFEVKLPDSISLAVVGVGTARGARIPNRDKYGVFRGYKKHDGKEVVTKLNESWLKSLSERVDVYRFWIANSYTIPTEEILTFFNSNYQKRLNKAKVTVRPVMVEIFLIPALLCLLVSFALYGPRSFSTLIVVFFVLITQKTSADEFRTEALEERIKAGEVGIEGKLKLAEIYLKDKKPELARVIYEEANQNEMTVQDWNNYAVSLVATKDFQKALSVWSDLQQKVRLENLNATEKQSELIRQNVLLALQQQKSSKSDKGESKDQKKEQKENQQENKNQSGEKNKSDSQKKEKGEKGKKDKEKSEKKKSGEEKGSDKFEKEKKMKSEKKPKSLKEQQEDIRKKRRMVKVPAIIKQIMSDDRNLQQEYLDTRTKNSSSRDKKDW